MKNRVYYNQEVMKMKQGIPSDRILVERAKFAVSSELKRKEQLNLPVAKFDAKSGQIYMHNSDGSITVLAQGMKRGRYSERCREKT